jgi:hypothetical protein
MLKKTAEEKPSTRKEFFFRKIPVCFEPTCGKARRRKNSARKKVINNG